MRPSGLRLRIDISKLYFQVYSLLIVVLIASATQASKEPVTMLLLVLMASALLVKKKGVRWLKDMNGVRLMLVFATFLSVHFIRSGIFTIGSIKFCLTLLMTYHLVKQFGRKYTDTLFSVLYYLTLITVPFYILQILSYSTLESVLSVVNIAQNTDVSEGRVNIFFFNMIPWAPYRNSGFMWEPGAFGAMLTFLVIYRYVVVDGMALTKKSIWLLIYSLTTLSTTTLVALLISGLLFLAVRYKRQRLKLIVSVFALALMAIPIYNLPFVGEKIEYQARKNVDYKAIYEIRKATGENYSIGRFAGVLIEFNRVRYRPMFGFGWDNDYEAVGVGNLWSNPSGLAVLLGKFGFAGIMLLVYALAFIVPKGMPVHIRLAVGLILLLSLFSNPFQYNIVFWTLVMIGLVNSNGFFKKSLAN